MSVVLAWIPGHAGIHGNEKADELAKKATSSGINLPYPLPYTDIYHLSTNTFNQSLLKFITNPNCTKGTFYIDNCFANSSKPWFHSRDLSRDQVTTFSRMRSNHYNLAFSLFRKNLTDSPMCPCGDEAEDLNHIFWSCPRFDVQRSTLLKSLAKLKLFPSFTISQFLFAPKSSIIVLLHGFLKSCNISL